VQLVFRKQGGRRDHRYGGDASLRTDGGVRVRGKARASLQLASTSGKMKSLRQTGRGRVLCA